MKDRFKFDKSTRLGRVLSTIFGDDERNLVGFSMGLGIPAAIANKYFDFPIGKIEAHPDFRLIAAGNTFGTGADHVYSGRFCLDGASLDRFSTVTVPYSPTIEKSITNGDTQLLDFCYRFRKLTKGAGIKSILSYRGLGAITRLKGSMDLKDVLRICIVKGMNKDDVNTIKQGLPNDSNNEYIKAFKQL